MLIFREIKPNLLPASCLALGMFDGVHLGHKKVILNAVNKSRALDAIPAIVTFAEHPLNVLGKKKVNLISTLDARLNIFEELGVGAAIVLDFNHKLAEMSAEEYLKSILISGLNPRSITTGYNHHFGAGKKGDIKLLERYSAKYNYEITVIPPVIIDKQIVSSTVVRKFISSGDVLFASKLLGRPFSLQGKVIEGMQRGRQLGFPTANLEIDKYLILPATGVYAAIVDIDGNLEMAVVNVGKRPTIGDLSEDLIEVHILNFDENLYGREIEVCFMERLRSEQKFTSLDELKTQIEKDCQAVLNLDKSSWSFKI